MVGLQSWPSQQCMHGYDAPGSEPVQAHQSTHARAHLSWSCMQLHHGCMLPGPQQCALGPRQTCHASASLRTTVLLTTRQERCFATHCHKQAHTQTQREVYLYCAQAACTTHCHAVSTAAFDTPSSWLLRTHSSTLLLNHKSHTVSCAERQRYMHV